jgi:hypothetical protein
MQPEVLPTHSQMPAICPYSEPDQCLPIPLLEDDRNQHTLILSKAKDLLCYGSGYTTHENTRLQTNLCHTQPHVTWRNLETFTAHSVYLTET